ncbi:MAG: O-antigen ligase family protein, partial [Alphaproteobacteria bacterium]
ILSAALALPLLSLCAITRPWLVAPEIGLPIAAIGALWLWLVLAGCWSASGTVLSAKLPEIVLLGPIMLLAGLVVAGDDAALRGFCAGVIGAGAAVALSLANNLAQGSVALGGLPYADAEKWRVAYQVTGLAIAMAAALAALHWAEARGALLGCFWLGATLALALGVLLPGGRSALVALGLCLASGPALILYRQQKRARAALWALGLLCLAAGAALFTATEANQHARDIKRLFSLNTLESSGRLALWGAALALAGSAMPFGLGTGGFSLAAGFGEWRGRHPHNLALEALAEAGLPGFALWLIAFGGSAWVIWRLGRTAPSWRLARILMLCLPMAVTLQVSTDLGNRMAWLTLGLALGLGLRAEAPGKEAFNVRALG